MDIITKPWLDDTSNISSGDCFGRFVELSWRRERCALGLAAQGRHVAAWILRLVDW